MGERAKKIGEKLEGFGEKLFDGFGWKEIVRDREISCTKSLHKKRTHGLDIFFSMLNPYTNVEQGIVIECKNRQMTSITDSEIEKWIKELINTIDCVKNSEQLVDLSIDNVVPSSGILLIHANDKFDSEKFQKSVKKVSLPSRKDPINIYIAGNDEIDRWNSLREKIRSEFKGEFKFIYPSINGSDQLHRNFISLDYLYSKYIFATNTHYVSNTDLRFDSPVQIPKSQKIIFSFDDNIVESFKYIWSLFKFYQMQDADEYVFIFYPRKPEDTQFITEKFVMTLKELDLPISDEMERKIRIEFMDNRALSPVDTGR